MRRVKKGISKRQDEKQEDAGEDNEEVVVQKKTRNVEIGARS